MLWYSIIVILLGILLLLLLFVIVVQVIQYKLNLKRVEKIPGISVPFGWLIAIPLSKIPSFLVSFQSPFTKISTKTKQFIQQESNDIIFRCLRKQAVVAKELHIPSAPHTSHKGFWRATFGTNNLFITQDAEMFKEILITHSKQFNKRGIKNPLFYKKNVLTANGEEWRKSRTLMAPAFTDGPLSDIMVTAFDQITEELIKEWSAKETIENLWSEMAKLSIKVISVAGFGFHFETQTNYQFSQVLASVNELFQTFTVRSLIPERLFGFVSKLSIFSTVIAKINRSSKQWISFVDHVIQEKTSNKENLEELDPSSVLSRMVTAKETSNEFEMEDLRSNSNVLLLAGHETTTNTLSWAFHFLSQFPKVQQIVRDEVTVLLTQAYETKQPITLQQFESQFMYTKAVILETLRLHSPAFAVAREAKEDITLQGSDHCTYFIPKHTNCILAFNLANMDTVIWKEKVNEFVPERFLNHETWSGILRYAFQPFNVGPRQCLGKRFAEMEMVLVLAKVVYHFELIPKHPNETIPEKVEFTMKPGAPIAVHLKPLHKKSS